MAGQPGISCSEVILPGIICAETFYRRDYILEPIEKERENRENSYTDGNTNNIYTLLLMIK